MFPRKASITILAGALILLTAVASFRFARIRERARCLFFLHGMLWSELVQREARVSEAYRSREPDVSIWACLDLVRAYDHYESLMGGTSYAQHEALDFRRAVVHGRLCRLYAQTGDEEQQGHHLEQALTFFGQTNEAVLFQRIEALDTALRKRASERSSNQETPRDAEN